MIDDFAEQLAQLKRADSDRVFDALARYVATRRIVILAITKEASEVGDPKRCLELLNMAASAALNRAPPDTLPIVDDATMPSALARPTGFTRCVYYCARNRTDQFSSFCVGQIVSETELSESTVAKFVRDALWHFSHSPMAPHSPAFAVVHKRETRHSIAKVLATAFFGSSQAILNWDYSLIEDQQLCSGYPTDALGWAAPAVNRFPWWVIVIDQFELQAMMFNHEKPNP